MNTSMPFALSPELDMTAWQDWHVLVGSRDLRPLTCAFHPSLDSPGNVLLPLLPVVLASTRVPPVLGIGHGCGTLILYHEPVVPISEPRLLRESKKNHAEHSHDQTLRSTFLDLFWYDTPRYREVSLLSW